MGITKRLVYVTSLCGILVGCGNIELVNEAESRRFSGEKGSEQNISQNQNIEKEGLYLNIPLPEASVEGDKMPVEEKVADEAIEVEEGKPIEFREKSERISIQVLCPNHTYQDEDVLVEKSAPEGLALRSLFQPYFLATLKTYHSDGGMQLEQVSAPVRCKGAAVRIHITKLKLSQKYQLSGVFNTGFVKYTGTTESFSLRDAFRTNLIMTRNQGPKTSSATINVIFKDKPSLEPIPLPEPPIACTQNYEWLYHPTSFEPKAGNNGCVIKALKAEGFLTLQQLVEKVMKEMDKELICTLPVGNLQHPETKHIVKYTNGCQEGVLFKAGFTKRVPLDAVASSEQ